MVMKASLQLRIGTQLTMTPQLQQAIALLQLSTLDLRQEIQQALDANPMLEQEDEFGEQAVSAVDNDACVRVKEDQADRRFLGVNRRHHQKHLIPDGVKIIWHDLRGV